MPADRSESLPIERTHHSFKLHERVFAKFLNLEGIDSVLDVGAGDSSYAEKRSQQTSQAVYRVDIDYAQDPPAGDRWVAGSATELPFKAEAFDATMTSFMMQHLSPDQQCLAIEEMVRVTSLDDEAKEEKGFIGIFPVYKSDKLRKILQQTGLDEYAQIHEQIVPAETRGNIVLNKLSYPTLWLHKTPELTPEKTAQLALTIAESGTLSKRLKMSDRLIKIMLARQGHNRYDTRA